MTELANSAGRESAVGVIDLGSNSVLLLVLSASAEVLHDQACITRLGEGVFLTGVLSPRARERTLACVRELAERARRFGVGSLVGVGTEALRRARDGRSFLEELRADGLLDEVHLLEPQQEASLAIEASRRAHGAAGPGLLVIDVGGGSTEVAWLAPGTAVRGLSLPLGSVRLTETHALEAPLPRPRLRELREAVRAAATVLTASQAGSAEIVAVAGTATTLAAMELELERYDPAAVEGCVLGREVLARWIDRLSLMSVGQRRRVRGLEPGRADVIVAGLVVLEGVLERIGARSFRISGRGVRHGVALRLLEGKSPV